MFSIIKGLKYFYDSVHKFNSRFLSSFYTTMPREWGLSLSTWNVASETEELRCAINVKNTLDFETCNKK